MSLDVGNGRRGLSVVRHLGIDKAARLCECHGSACFECDLLWLLRNGRLCEQFRRKKGMMGWPTG
jgi:hypothetical protein